jgi:hypothetical protein
MERKSQRTSRTKKKIFKSNPEIRQINRRQINENNKSSKLFIKVLYQKIGILSKC